LADPLGTQQEVLEELIGQYAKTDWGQSHGLLSSDTLQDFQQKMPVVDYESVQPLIHRMMLGERDLLWPGRVTWYSKSSGTTGSKSKYIPVTDDNISQCLLKGSHDVMCLWYNSAQSTQLLSSGKGLVMGGSHYTFEENAETRVGDVSAIMLENMPPYAKFFHEPGLDIALMNEWEAKIERMAHHIIGHNITNMSGVPTWTLVLMKRVLEITGKSNFLEVFPNFELYIHGGVSFEPYREQFKKLLPGNQVKYRQVYNASEGFFAVQLNEGEDDMVLLLGNGIFYEFISLDQLGQPFPEAKTVDNAELDKNYALVISNNSGLCRYMIGDTVKVTSLKPFKIKVSGRTKQFINAFGEEVMVENTDKAIALTCAAFGVTVLEYTVAPVYFDAQDRAGHQWLIEFEDAPADLAEFAQQLDLNLQAQNSDYEAKRYKDIALKPLKIEQMPKGTFHEWLKRKGKLGGQHKVPRLSNNRDYVDEILSFVQG
jgi:hypothetical protein